MDYLKSVSGLLLLLLCTSILPARTWTDTKGNSFEGEFVRLTDDNQVVVKKDGSDEVYTVPMDRFSGTDQSYVKAQVEAAKKTTKETAEGKIAVKSTGKLKKIREWTSPNGDKRKAKFVRMNEGKVVLMAGNKGVVVEFSQFSKEDQDFLRNELEAIGQGDQIPTGTDLLQDKDSIAKIKRNPDDHRALLAFANANFGSLSRLMATDPDAAEKQLDAMAKLMKATKPKNAQVKSLLKQINGSITSFKQKIAVEKFTLEELEARLAKDIDDAEAIPLYSLKKAMEIGPSARANPREAAASLAKVEGFLKSISDKTKKDSTKAALAQATANLSSIKRSIEGQIRLLELVGKNSIPLGIDQWTNGAPIIDAELKGKVVLLDFWAVWCGPCVATFPHLSEWNKDHAEEGLVILGLTRLYNYEWNADSKKAVRASRPVDVKVELGALEKFAQSHDLGHRIGIQPKDNRLSEYYAVSGIPHVVLIDRKGVIQMVKVGSGPANAKALDKKIKELLAE